MYSLLPIAIEINFCSVGMITAIYTLHMPDWHGHILIHQSGFYSGVEGHFCHPPIIFHPLHRNLSR